MRWFKTILTFGPVVTYNYFRYLRKFERKPQSFPLEFRYNKVKTLVKTLSKKLRVEFIVEGKENLPKDQKVCMICNHLSAFDPLVFLSLFEEPTTFVSKIENRKLIAVSGAITGIEGVYLDRNDLKQSLRIMMGVQKDLEMQRKNWVIFPEGTRNKDPLMNLGDFHHGTFRPAVKSGTPIVPVCIYGTNGVLKFHPELNKYPVIVKFLKPITKEEYQGMTTQEIAVMVRGKIQAALDFGVRAKYHEKMLEYNKGLYAPNKIL